MSDVIQGARTRNYVKTDIPGIQNSGDTLEYATVQEAPGKRAALDAVIHGSFVVSTGHAIETGSVKRLIKSTAHGAQKGWFMRPSSGLSKGEEIAIVKIIDADFFVIAEEFDLAIADTFSVCRLITPNYTEAGDLNVVVTASGPVQFLKDAVITTVSEDTVIPENTTALPVKFSPKVIVDNLFFLYVGVSNAGYTQLIASTPDQFTAMTYFESGGFPTVIAVGAAGLEIDKFMIPPGGLNGEIPIDIPAGSRISVKELVADAIDPTNFIVANFYK